MNILISVITGINSLIDNILQPNSIITIYENMNDKKLLTKIDLFFGSAINRLIHFFYK